MQECLLMSWVASDLQTEAQAVALSRKVQAPGRWRTVIDRPGLAALCRVGFEAPLSPGPAGDGLLIGEVFPHPTGLTHPLRHQPPCSPAEISAWLCGAVWGAYVFVQPSDRAGRFSVFRDPSGGREAFVWRRERLCVVASTLSDPDLAPLLPSLQVNWSRVAGFVADPGRISGDLALDGVTAAAPGELVILDAERVVRTSVWTPAGVVRSTEPVLDRAEARLSECIDASVAAWAGSASNLLVEVSGGLDSAIVACALNKGTRRSGLAWINHHVDDPGADERVYARALAQKHAFELIEALKPPTALHPADLARVADAARPSLNGADAEYDQGVVERCRSVGTGAVMTGQGGDTVLFGVRSPWLAADHLRDRGLRGLLDPAMLALARWTRTSLWTVGRQGVMGALGLARPPARAAPAFVSAAALEAARAEPPHPWLRDLAGLAPGRRLQVQGLADALLFHGECRRTRQVRLLHPLLSQPVVELCLSIPISTLTQGGRDRALARDAYADRLPREIFERRIKGDLTAYYGRMVRDALPQLRRFLLDGVLAGQGLLATDRLRAMLTEEHLIWRGGYADFMDLATIEAWARHWTAQTRPAP